MVRDERGKLSSYRRDVMKLVGAGTLASAVGGTAVAQDDGAGEGDGGPDEGDDTGDANESEGNAVHEVRTLIGVPPTNPNRPADFFYQPTGLHVQPGDVIRWVFETPDHNVVSMHPAYGMRRRVPTGVDAFSSPLLGWRPESIPGDQVEPPTPPGIEGEPPEGSESGDGNGDSDDPPADGGPVPDTWLYSFETPGVYDLLCSPHETFGMAMRVVVGDVTDAGFETGDPEALPEPRAGPVGLSRVTLTDPALRPSAIVEQGTVEWSSLEANQGGGEAGTDTTESASADDGGY